PPDPAPAALVQLHGGGGPSGGGRSRRRRRLDPGAGLGLPVQLAGCVHRAGGVVVRRRRGVGVHQRRPADGPRGPRGDRGEWRQAGRRKPLTQKRAVTALLDLFRRRAIMQRGVYKFTVELTCPFRGAPNWGDRPMATLLPLTCRTNGVRVWVAEV